MTPKALRAALRRRMDHLLAHIRAELYPELLVAEIPTPERYLGRDLKPIGVDFRPVEPPRVPTAMDYQREILRILGHELAVMTLFGPIYGEDKPWPYRVQGAGEIRYELPAAAALDHLEAEANRLVGATAENLLGAVDALLPSHVREAAVDRLVDRWPWNDGRNDPHELGWLYLLVSWCRELPKGEPVPLMWPAEAAPADVHEWVRVALNRHEPGKGDRLAETTGPDAVRFPLWGLDFLSLSSGGLALLYLAETELGPRAPTMGLLSVERAPVRLATSLAGAHPGDLARGATLESDPTELVFSWPEQGDDESQLRLPLTPPGAGVLTAVGLRFGPAAVRDVLALYLFTWAARAAANEAVWWWPDEHLEICGLDDQTKHRRRLADLWADLGNARLRARYKHGRPLDGPVVSTIASAGGAYLLQFHPALYRGVTKTDGKPGDYFWPIPVGLLQLEADRSHGKVHVLAALLGAQWRRKWKADDPESAVARVSAGHLADSLALDRTRGHRSRAAETLRASLEAGKRCGLIERYEVERGRISDLSAMLQIFPTGPVGGKIERPKWIPATGDDLVRWMDTERLTASAVGELLGEKPATVRQWRSRYQGRPLPTRARRALRAVRWGAFE